MQCVPQSSEFTNYIGYICTYQPLPTHHTTQVTCKHIHTRYTLLYRQPCGQYATGASIDRHFVKFLQLTLNAVCMWPLQIGHAVAHMYNYACRCLLEWYACVYTYKYSKTQRIFTGVCFHGHWPPETVFHSEEEVVHVPDTQECRVSSAHNTHTPPSEWMTPQKAQTGRGPMPKHQQQPKCKGIQ